jgi:hypothetical protein
MSKMIKDYLDVNGDDLLLDDLIARLTAVRDTLPAGAEARVKMRGDDVFGRHLCVAYRRPLTEEEADVLGRYGGEVRELRRAA